MIPAWGSPGAGSPSRPRRQASSAEGTGTAELPGPGPAFPGPAATHGEPSRPSLSQGWHTLPSHSTANAWRGCSQPPHSFLLFHCPLPAPCLVPTPQPLSPVFPIKLFTPPPPAMWLAYHPFPKLFLSSQLKHFPLLDGILPPRLLSRPCLCPGIVAEDFSIRPLWSIGQHVSLVRRFCWSSSKACSMHIPLQQVPNPQQQMLLILVITGGPHIPCHLTAPSLPTCAQERLRRAGELLLQGPALPAKGELIGTAPTPARAHARQQQPCFEGSPPERPANYIASC